MRAWDRREVVVGAGACVCAVAIAARAKPASGAIVPPSPLALADARFAESRAFAAAAVSSGSRVVWTEGDVTDLWYRELDLLWRRERASLTGMTTRAPLFYLERLAMDRGLRVVFRDTNGDPLIRWLIASKPTHGVFA